MKGFLPLLALGAFIGGCSASPTGEQTKLLHDSLPGTVVIWRGVSLVNFAATIKAVVCENDGQYITLAFVLEHKCGRALPLRAEEYALQFESYRIETYYGSDVVPVGAYHKYTGFTSGSR